MYVGGVFEAVAVLFFACALAFTTKLFFAPLWLVDPVLFTSAFF